MRSQAKNIFLSLVIACGLSACMPEDPNDLITQERAIISYFIDGAQIGPAEITRTTTKSEFVINVLDGTDMTNVIPVIEISKGATISPASGEAIDLSSGSFTYVVTSEGGVKKEWTLTVETFENLFHGKWYVGKPMEYFYHIGEGESWGWSGTKNVEWAIPAAANANDNTLELITTGVDADGNLIGNGNYAAGDDESYEDFYWANTCEGDLDFNPHYGKMPHGEFTWVLDLTEDKFIFTKDGKETSSMELEWNPLDNSINPNTAFRLPFEPQAQDFGWIDCGGTLDLINGKKAWYTFVKEGYKLPGDDELPEPEYEIPTEALFNLDGNWGITDIGFWPSGDKEICNDFDNILTFSGSTYNATTGILSGNFTYNAGADGILTNLGEGAGEWKVFPESGTYELAFLVDPNETDKPRKHWKMKFFDASGTEIPVENAPEGSTADDIIFKFNGGKFANGEESESHWYKLQRDFIGKNPCIVTAPDEFFTGTWGAHSGTSAMFEYTDNHYPVAGTEATLDDTYTFSEVVVSEDGFTWTGKISVNKGADGETFDAGDYTLVDGATFTFVYKATDEWDGHSGSFTMHVGDKNVEFRGAKCYGPHDFQIQFVHEIATNDSDEMYYRLKK